MNLSCRIVVRITGLSQPEVPIMAPATEENAACGVGRMTAVGPSSSCLASVPQPRPPCGPSESPRPFHFWVWPRDLLRPPGWGSRDSTPVLSLGLQRPCKGPSVLLASAVASGRVSLGPCCPLSLPSQPPMQQAVLAKSLPGPTDVWLACDSKRPSV